MIHILVLISLFFFYLLFLGRTVMLVRKGVAVWVVGSSGKNLKEKILENILFPVLVLWSILIVLSALHRLPDFFMLKILTDAYFLQIAGVILCYAGIIIFLAALISFGSAWRIGIDENNSNELITSGIFKYSRNPIFLFMDLYFFGIMLVYPCAVFIAVTVCTIAGIHMQILREEKYLHGRFGNEYSEYQKKTRRYL